MNDRPGNGGAMSPYLAGALAGLLAIASVLVAGKYLGASTSFVRSAGLIEKMAYPERVAQMPYFISKTPKIDWQWMFVAGIFLGSLIASLMTKSFKWQTAPDSWQQRFGPGGLKRGWVAFGGGVIAMFGARLAGGCPSGHGLSGMAQLSVSGLVALAGFFLAGVVMARLLYGRS